MKNLSKYCQKHGLDLKEIVSAHSKPVTDTKAQKVPDDDDSEDMPMSDEPGATKRRAMRALKSEALK